MLLGEIVDICEACCQCRGLGIRKAWVPGKLSHYTCLGTLVPSFTFVINKVVLIMHFSQNIVKVLGVCTELEAWPVGGLYKLLENVIIPSDVSVKAKGSQRSMNSEVKDV